jgi:hypothetical protein
MEETTQTNEETQNNLMRVLAEQGSMVFRASGEGIWGLVAEHFSQMCHDLFVVGYIAGATSVTANRTEEPSETPRHADC